MLTRAVLLWPYIAMKCVYVHSIVDLIFVSFPSDGALMQWTGSSATVGWASRCSERKSVLLV